MKIFEVYYKENPSTLRRIRRKSPYLLRTGSPCPGPLILSEFTSRKVREVGGNDLVLSLFKQLLSYIQFFVIFVLNSCAAQHPSFIELYNQGVALHKSNPPKAIELFVRALEYEPDSIEAHYNAAFLLKEQGSLAKALPHYEFILSKQPNHAAAHLGRAIINLAFGKFDVGWPEFEWHLGSQTTDDAQILKKIIAHNLPLKDKIILLRAEWGAGDTIHMIRYAQLLHERGAHVIVHLLHESLVPLFKQQKYLDAVVAPHESPPPFHFQIPMMILPSIFGTTIENVPSPNSYITIDQEYVKKWKEIVKDDPLLRQSSYANATKDKGYDQSSEASAQEEGQANFKIGICWKGNYIHGPEKFMPLSYFAQLAHIPGVSLYSLQKMHGLDQLESLENKDIIKTFDDTFDIIPFLDTAALMKNLDLVITVDTSIAHLAGALGVPVWVILPVNSDWRWMQERIDTPWYKSMRLFRQKNAHDWENVIQEITIVIKKIRNQYN